MGTEQVEARIASTLKRADIKFLRNALVHGLRPDFVIESPDGRRYVLEVKSWAPSVANLDRASSQAQLYQQVTGATGAYIVLPDLKRTSREKGVIAEKDLARFLLSELGREAKGAGPRLKVVQSRQAVFAAMPFSEEYDDVYFVAMSYAAQQVGAACTRVDREEFSGDVVNEIETQIRRSIAVIGDLSESRPNVLYEVGFAHALRKPTVHICSTSLDDLPFDVRNWNTLPYLRGQTFRLRQKLARRLKSTLRTSTR